MFSTPQIIESLKTLQLVSYKRLLFLSIYLHTYITEVHTKAETLEQHKLVTVNVFTLNRNHILSQEDKILLMVAHVHVHVFVVNSRSDLLQPNDTSVNELALKSCLES